MITETRRHQIETRRVCGRVIAILEGASYHTEGGWGERKYRGKSSNAFRGRPSVFFLLPHSLFHSTPPIPRGVPYCESHPWRSHNAHRCRDWSLLPPSPLPRLLPSRSSRGTPARILHSFLLCSTRLRIGLSVIRLHGRGPLCAKSRLGSFSRRNSLKRWLACPTVRNAQFRSSAQSFSVCSAR